MKYEPLESFLRQQGGQSRTLSFAEIEAILGGPLPPSARKRREWWSNNPQGHVNAQAWLRAGYRAERVKIDEALVMFRRDEGETPKPRNGQARSLGFLDRIRAELGGTVTIMPGVDLTEPLWELPDDLK